MGLKAVTKTNKKHGAKFTPGGNNIFSTCISQQVKLSKSRQTMGYSKCLLQWTACLNFYFLLFIINRARRLFGHKNTDKYESKLI